VWFPQTLGVALTVDRFGGQDGGWCWDVFWVRVVASVTSAASIIIIRWSWITRVFADVSVRVGQRMSAARQFIGVGEFLVWWAITVGINWLDTMWAVAEQVLTMG
jgi:hypothetical protein